MPIGLFTDVGALGIGGLLGGLIGKHLSAPMKEAMNHTFGFCAIFISVTLMMKIHALAPVVLAVVLGTIIGELLRLEDRVQSLFSGNWIRIFCGGVPLEAAQQNTFQAVAVLFCCSGTGWYGVLTEGFTGDSSILLTKAILDFFTAVIFAAALGRVVSLLATPQLLIFVLLFGVSRLVIPLISAEMLADFSAVGGIVELTTGMRIAGIKRDTKVLNLTPAMLLVFPISALWTYFSL